MLGFQAEAMGLSGLGAFLFLGGCILFVDDSLESGKTPGMNPSFARGNSG
jgi:hypothetical protein